MSERGDRGLVAVLVMVRSATQPASIIMGLLLINIGLSFGKPAGVVGQAQTVAQSLSVVFSVVVGLVSARVSYKRLLLAGVACYCVSALGCASAGSFTVFIASFALTGVGFALVASMVPALIGELIPDSERPKVVGLSIAGNSTLYLVGAPVISYVSSAAGWRAAFTVFAFLFSAASLVAALRVIPDTGVKVQGGSTLVEGFNAIRGSRSAVYCLVGNALSFAAWTPGLYYGVTFFREVFMVSTFTASVLLSAVGICYTVGCVYTGTLVGRYGSRRCAEASAVLFGVFTVLFLAVRVQWLCTMLVFLTSFFSGLRQASADSLSLEQVPEFRGAMMALNTAAISLGLAFGAGAGGALILGWGYGALGALGLLGVLAGLLYRFYVEEP